MLRAARKKNTKKMGIDDLRQVVCRPTGSLPMPPKRINERVMEQRVDVPVPQMNQENVEDPVVEVVRLDECAQKFDAWLEPKSRILTQIANFERQPKRG